MRIRVVYQSVNETRDLKPWSEFLYEYRVKEYIWEKIAQGDATSLKEFHQANVHCLGCGKTPCEGLCENEFAERSSTDSRDKEFELVIRHESIWDLPDALKIGLWVSSVSIAAAMVPPVILIWR